MIEPGIFKAYDIRGIHPTQLDGEVARRIGRAFVDYLGARRIAVGRDVRTSSPEIARSFVGGARAQGCEVTDIGVASTDMLYYYVARNDLDGGAIITASHNPREWNGIKMVRKGALALSGDAGIKEIKEWVTGGRYADPTPPQAPDVSSVSILDEYARHCLSFIDPARVPRLRVVLDPGNGMGALGASVLVGPAALGALQSHCWPGNIRELKNVIERTILLSDDPVIDRGDLALDGEPFSDEGEANVTLREIERLHISRVLKEEDGRVARAATRLGIPRSSLYQKMRKLHAARANGRPAPAKE